MRGYARADRLDDAPSTGHRPQSHCRVATENNPPGYFVLASQTLEARGASLAPFLVTRGSQEGDDNPHGLLGIIRTVSQGVEASWDKLQMTEPFFGLVALRMPRQPSDSGHDGPSEDHADNGRNDKEYKDRNPTFDQDRFKAGLCDRRTGVAADNGVGGTGGERHEPRNDVPYDCADQAPADDINVDGFGIDQLIANSLCDTGPEEEGSDKVEKSSLQHSLEWGENTGSNDGGHRVGSIVEAIEEVKDKRDENQKEDKVESRHKWLLNRF
jgi:hypothetical protein